MDPSTPSLKSHWKTADIHAWTRPCQIKKVIETQIYNGMNTSTPSLKSHSNTANTHTVIFRELK